MEVGGRGWTCGRVKVWKCGSVCGRADGSGRGWRWWLRGDTRRDPSSVLELPNSLLSHKAVSLLSQIPSCPCLLKATCRDFQIPVRCPLAWILPAVHCSGAGFSSLGPFWPSNRTCGGAPKSSCGCTCPGLGAQGPGRGPVFRWGDRAVGRSCGRAVVRSGLDGPGIESRWRRDYSLPSTPVR